MVYSIYFSGSALIPPGAGYSRQRRRYVAHDHRVNVAVLSHADYLRRVGQVTDILVGGVGVGFLIVSEPYLGVADPVW